MKPVTTGRIYQKVVPAITKHSDPFDDIDIQNNCFALWILCEGSIRFTLDDHHYDATAPALICLDETTTPNVLTAHGAMCHSVYFHPTFLNGALDFAQLRRGSQADFADHHDAYLLRPFTEQDATVLPLFDEDSERARRAFDAMAYALKEQSDWYWPCRARSALIELLLILERAYGYIIDRERVESPVIVRHPILQSALAYMEQNYSRSITLSDIAAATASNRNTLTKQFGAEFGVSPMEYLWNYRLRVAEKLLAYTSMPLKAIAAACGFKTAPHFSRRFEDRAGCSPSKFRSQQYDRRNGAPLLQQTSAAEAPDRQAWEKGWHNTLRAYGETSVELYRYTEQALAVFPTDETFLYRHFMHLQWIAEDTASPAAKEEALKAGLRLMEVAPDNRNAPRMIAVLLDELGRPEEREKWRIHSIDDFRRMMRTGRGEAVLWLREEPYPCIFSEIIVKECLSDTGLACISGTHPEPYLDFLISQYSPADQADIVARICIPQDYAPVRYFEMLSRLARRGHARAKNRLLQLYHEKFDLVASSPAPQAPCYAGCCEQYGEFCTLLYALSEAGIRSSAALARDLTRLSDEVLSALCRALDRKDASFPADILSARSDEDDPALFRFRAVYTTAVELERAAWETWLREHPNPPKQEAPSFANAEEMIDHMAHHDLDPNAYFPAFRSFELTDEQLRRVYALAFKQKNNGYKTALYNLLSAKPPVADVDALLADVKQSLTPELFLVHVTDDCSNRPYAMLNLLVKHYRGQPHVRRYLTEALAELGAFPHIVEQMKLAVLAYDAPERIESYLRSLPDATDQDLIHLHDNCYYAFSLCRSQKDSPLSAAWLRTLYERAPDPFFRSTCVTEMMREGLLTEDIRRVGIYDSDPITRTLCRTLSTEDTIAATRERGVAFAPGLTENEIATIEERYGITFPAQWRECYTRALPVGEKYPDWRDDTPENVARIRALLDRPIQDILAAIQTDDFWRFAAFGERPADMQAALDIARRKLCAAPRLIPLRANHYLIGDRMDCVISVDGATITRLGLTLNDYWRAEFSLPTRGGIPIEKDLPCRVGWPQNHIWRLLVRP